MAGLLGTTLRAPSPEPEPDVDPEDVDLSETIVADGSKPSVVIEFPDGSVTVNFGKPAEGPALKDTKFDDNLALSLDETALGVLCEDLMRGIEEDDLSRHDWLDERAEGIKLLALKIEKPQSSGSTGVENTSRSRHTLLLEAALRFQANARGELLPTDGPVKIEAKNGRDTLEGDDLASMLEDDFNYYLQTTASEYYPDTDRMLLWTGVGGSGFKKVYRCPVRRRPVSESVDAADLIVSSGATDLLNAERVTFVSRMRQSTMKRMKYLKVYRDVALAMPSYQMQNSVDEEKEAVTGITISNRPEDIPHTILECYAMTDVIGDEHKDKGEITGLPRPYKIAIDKDSRTILEIRRNWHQQDEMERPRETFVKFPFVPGFGFYELGLIHIAGNPTVAATALLRIMIDSGIYGNFPGGLVAKGTDKQNTSDISVPPGGFAPIDVSMIPDGDIKKAVMALPYKEAGQAIMALFQDIVTTGSRVAGAADVAVGEGRADAPVGTTLALIEQATKVTDAVHKRLHTAQSKEFELLRNLFREYPEDFWRFNQDRDSNWDKEKLLKALNDYNLIPRADPNTSSQLQRIMRAQAMYQLAAAHPELFQIRVVLEWILRVLGVRNPDSLLAPNGAPAGPGPDPKAQAAMIKAKADETNANAKLADVQLRSKNIDVENENRDLDRNADLKISDTKLKTEALIHNNGVQADAAQQARQQQHETNLAGIQASSDHAATGLGLASEHSLQEKDHDHAIKLAKLKPPAPKPKSGK